MRRSGSMSGQSRPRFPVRPAAMAAFAMLSLAAMARQPAHADNKWYPGSLCQRMASTSDVYATDYLSSLERQRL